MKNIFRRISRKNNIPQKCSVDYINRETKICLTALLSTYAAPDGYFYPCCITSHSEDDRLLAMKGGSFIEAFNSEKIKGIRRQLAKGEWPSACTSCQHSEAVGRKSHRQIFNSSSLSDHVEVVSRTAPDGQVNYPIRALDVRWNNTCNFKCRMCSPSFSSAWEQDYKALGLTYDPPYDWSSAVETDEFISILKTVTSIRFAGGEPLITDAHYEVVNKLIELDTAQKITLNYTTNLSILKYKQYDLLEKWRHFKQVNLVFSLDGFGRVVEYSREGFNHERFIRNIAELKKNPEINLYSHCVSSIFSILSIPDYIRFCQRNHIDFGITCITHPPHYSSKILSNDIKAQIREVYDEKLSQRDFDYSFILNDMDREIEDAEALRRSFKQLTESLDQIRGKKFCECFPQFSGWFEEIE